MGLELQYGWVVGNVSYRHEDYAVCEVEQLNKVQAVLASFETAEQAISAAEELGTGYAACRRVRRGDDVRPRELLSRDDLPIRLIGDAPAV